MERRGEAAAVAANPLWYHTMDVAPGVVTPGWFDLRGVLDRLPWPEVRGRRCLDVGTYDGHLAFELERRGAAEVVATDLSDHSEWDFPVRLRGLAGERLDAIAGEDKARGFHTAAELLGSSVQRLECNVYDLEPERVGTFDVVVCGSLLLHLRDPLRALDAIRSVCTGDFVSIEEVLPRVELAGRRRPIAQLDGLSELCQWWTPNRAGHRRMVEAAGFDVVRAARPLAIPLGPGHPRPRPTPRRLARRAAVRLMTGGAGLPISALLARPVGH